MLMQKVVLTALACALAGAAYGADSARGRANERNAELGRTAATPVTGCDELQGPERTACLAKGQSPMGSGGSSGTTAQNKVTKHKRTHRSSAKSKTKKKAGANRSSSKPANPDRNASSETATGVTSGVAASGAAERGSSGAPQSGTWR